MIQSYRNLQKKSLKFFNNRFLMKILIIKTIFTLGFYYILFQIYYKLHKKKLYYLFYQILIKIINYIFLKKIIIKINYILKNYNDRFST